MLETVKPRDLLTVPSGDGAGVVRLEVPDLGDVMEVDATRRRHEARRYRGALVMAAVLHAGLLGAFAASWSRDAVGAMGTSLDTISVEISLVPASGLAAASRDKAPTDTPDPVPTAPAAATPEPTPPPKAETAPKPDIVAKTDPAPPNDDAPVLDIRETPKPAETKTPEPEPVERETKPETPPTPAAEPAPPPTPSLRASAAAPSPGAIQAYAREVVAALAASRPKTPRGSGRGTVRILFAISESGTIDEAHVKLSSGNATIDEAALQAVRRASFRPPPAGMSRGERTYEVPYQFR